MPTRIAASINANAYTVTPMTVPIRWAQVTSSANARAPWAKASEHTSPGARPGTASATDVSTGAGAEPARTAAGSTAAARSSRLESASAVRPTAAFARAPA